MLDRWRLAIVFAAFGFVASAALIAHVTMGGFADLDIRWGWAINAACPAHFLITQFFPYVNSGTPMMLLLWIAQTAGNAAIWFCAGAIITNLVGSR